MPVVFSSCVPTPESYPVPPQHALVAAPEPRTERGFVSATDIGAGAFFVKDVKGLENGSWRWTGQNPALRFRLFNVSKRKALVDFTIHESTFKDTGPLRINFYVNGRLLEKALYDVPGDKTFQKLVPEGWLKLDSDNTISLDIENPWIAPTDGVKLGVLLRGAGFVE